MKKITLSKVSFSTFWIKDFDAPSSALSFDVDDLPTVFIILFDMILPLDITDIVVDTFATSQPL